jgi:N-acetylmuramoyl-L-alanine amidase
MERRSFLKLLGQGLLVSCGFLTGSSLASSSNAFDLALEGQDLIQQKKFPQAINVLNQAVVLDPDSDWAFGLLGRAYRELGQKAEAVAAFRNSVRLNPQDSYSRMMIEIMTQKPIPGLKKMRRQPPSALEKQAYVEEVEMISRIQAQKGLEYNVRRVVIDPGHGGFDSGAVGRNGLKEKDVTLDLARRLHERLKYNERVKSFLTRTGDYYVPLSARTATANQYQADLFISMHINANEKRTSHGSETYYCSEKASSAEAEKVAALENSVVQYDEIYKKKPGYIDIEAILFKFEQRLYWSESGKFANAFQERFRKRLPLKSRGVHSANFYVLRKAKMPSILLETGFISNPDDEARLKKSDFREKIVDAIFMGLS